MQIFRSPLVIDGDFVNSVISIEDHEFKEICMKFVVEEVTAWGIGNDDPLDFELLYRGEIKWDGCSHVWFGDEDGYLHLCGKPTWDLLQRSLKATFGLAKDFLPGYNAEVAE